MMLLIIIVLGYSIFYWGMHNLFRNKFLDYFVIAFSTIILYRHQLLPTTPEMMPISNCCFFIFGFIMYFSIGSSIVFLLNYILEKSNHISKRLKYTLLKINFVVTLVILIYGYFNAINPHVHNIYVPLKNMKICFVSDVHIGSIGTEKRLSTLVDMINKQKVDLIIFGGDIFDPLALSYYRELTVKQLSNLKSKYGSIAVLGNHEGYCGNKKAIDLYKEIGIRVLYDEAVVINGIRFIGRADHNDQKKKPLNNLLSNDNIPIVVIDHNPNAVVDAVKAKAVLQLSGHTHAGQMWPVNYKNNLTMLTGQKLVWKNTIIYISPGFGFWGPPFRIGNQPEIAVIQPSE